jgi:hypothetical protein
MKNLLLPACIFFCLSCTLQEPVSEVEVTKEVIALTHTYSRVWEILDMDSVALYHDDSIFYYWHGFLAASSDKEFVKVFREWIEPVKIWLMEVENMDVQFLSPDLAIVGFNTSSMTNIFASGEESGYGTDTLSYGWKRRAGGLEDCPYTRISPGSVVAKAMTAD